MAGMNCRLDLPEVAGLQSSEMTVGRIAFLSCTGEFPDWNEKTPLRLEAPPEHPYAVRMLGFEKLSAETYKLKLTSYQPGEWVFPNLALTDGQIKIDLGEVRLDVKSVISQQSPPEKPFGFVGPVEVAIPPSWWLALFGIVLALLLFGALEARKKWQRRKLLESLSKHDSALSPITEFHQGLRRIRRDSPLLAGGEFAEADMKDFVERIEKAFRLFILRRFRVPANTWSDRVLVAALVKENKDLSPKLFTELKKILREFKLVRTEKKIEAKDAIQLADLSRRLVEALENASGGSR